MFQYHREPFLFRSHFYLLNDLDSRDPSLILDKKRTQEKPVRSGVYWSDSPRPHFREHDDDECINSETSIRAKRGDSKRREIICDQMAKSPLTISVEIQRQVFLSGFGPHEMSIAILVLEGGMQGMKRIKRVLSKGSNTANIKHFVQTNS